jgi:predicted esterase
VLLPPSFNKEAVYPLIILMHGSHVTAWGLNIISYAPKDWAIQVALHDRGNNDYRNAGEVDLEEVMSEVTKRYQIDLDRLYLSGHSMGGYGAWFLATHYPDRWAAISPQTGYTDLSLDDAVAARSRLEFQKRMIQSHSPITFAENLLHVPAYMMHGAMDLKLPAAHSRKMDLRLNELGYEHIYDEHPTGGHWWGSRPAHEGVLCVDKPEISQFFLGHARRAQNPRVVIYKTDSLRYRRAYWVTVDELDADNQMAVIRAEVVSPNDIAVQLENITQFTLRLNDQLIRIDQPVTVSVNGGKVFTGPLPASSRLTLRREMAGNYIQIAAMDDDRLDGLAIKKTEHLYGPVVDAFNRPFLLVVGTQGDGDEARQVIAASRRAALAMARDWMTRANGIARIKADGEVTPDDIASFNLILFGNAATNSLLSKINDAMPLKLTPKGIVRGERIISGDDAGLIMIRPNPLNAGRYVVVVGGNTPRVLETAMRLRMTDIPDYVVFDGSALSGKHVEFLDGGYFDKHWQ